MIASAPEVEWDDVEVGWMRALQEWRTEELCECGCGFPRAIAQDPMTEWRVKVSSVRCHITSAIAKARQDYAKAENARPEGLVWSVEVGEG